MCQTLPLSHIPATLFFPLKLFLQFILATALSWISQLEPHSDFQLTVGFLSGPGFIHVFTLLPQKIPHPRSGGEGVCLVADNVRKTDEEQVP